MLLTVVSQASHQFNSWFSYTLCIFLWVKDFVILIFVTNTLTELIFTWIIFRCFRRFWRFLRIIIHAKYHKISIREISSRRNIKKNIWKNENGWFKADSNDISIFHMFFSLNTKAKNYNFKLEIKSAWKIENSIDAKINLLKDFV